jgi:TatA/E family protein of Tat protein translocase
MFGLGAGELFLIFIIALLFLGPKKLPELAKGLGQAVREFQKARDEMMNEMNKPHPSNTPSTETKKDVEVTAVKVEDEAIEVHKTETKSESDKLS